MNPVSTEFSPAPPPPFLKIAYIYNGTAALAIILATLLGTFSMVALVALFFCKRIREDYISEEGRRTNLSAESSGLNPRRARSKEENKGLQKDVLDAFPVMMWSEISCKKSSWDCCAVCLGELGEGAGKIRVLPNCGHWFHLECIDTWFFSHSTCPVCRACLAPSIQSSNVSTISNQSSDRRDNISVIPLQISEGTDQSSDRRDRVSARAPSIESSERTDHIAITIE